MRGPRRVFFLGAGASHDAGVPGTESLLRNVSTRIHNNKGRGQLRRFIKMFGPASESNGVDLPIINVINTLNSALREERPLDHFFDMERLRNIRKQLTIELSYILTTPNDKGERLRIPEKYQAEGYPKYVIIPEYYRRFCELLTPASTPENVLNEGDAIITTNYDINMDLALFDFTISGDNRISDIYLGSTFRDWDDYDAYYDIQSPIALLKLHGSLNWLFCPRCSRMYIAAYINTVRFLEKGPIQHRQCHCVYQPLEPVLIAPSALQEVTNPHLMMIWIHAYMALEKRDTWVFVGYSLPPQDYAVRTLLYRAWSARNSRKQDTSITIVNLRKNRHKLMRLYTDLFTDSKHIKYVSVPFENYVNKMKYQLSITK